MVVSSSKILFMISSLAHILCLFYAFSSFFLYKFLENFYYLYITLFGIFCQVDKLLIKKLNKILANISYIVL